MSNRNWNVAVVGLGYVGLPLAIEFGKHFQTIGFDVSEAKIASYREGRDAMGEVPREAFAASRHVEFTADSSALARADIILVAVPTPIDEARKPDLRPLISASETIAPNLKAGAIVCYESTVYPGATEEVCVPVLEKLSGKRWKRDFFVGYSPERINPGDKKHTLSTVIKVVAGDTPKTLDTLSEFYGAVVSAGVHRASSIRVAEAAKVIENTQRDLNIALMNELAIIFDKLGLDTLEVLEAAGTKWNFLPFRPGLVGGHCIGVDPYYLTHKAEVIGYHPQVILAGRRINDGMGKFIAEQTVKQMIACGSPIKGAKVNVLGLTFKEDVPDLRNSRAVDVVHELQTYGVEVTVHDPIAATGDAHEEYGIKLTDWDALPVADAVVLAVAHQDYIQRPSRDYVAMLRRGGCFVDVKARFDRKALEAASVKVWRL
jgi:UDP-N-acetyl-D-glucosamine/UDP-N-acetyl-D-galactosamine dehydrogenase